MSTLNVANVTDGTTSVPTGYVVNGSAKARVMYDLVANAVHTSLNISSVTDDGTGTYTHNYTSAFSGSGFRDKVYAGMCPGNRVIQFTGSSSATSTQFRVVNPSTDGVSDTNSSVIVHGDLA
jgi:hypothetical protein